MRRALRLAVLGKQTHPNPMVGCVIVGADGTKLGEGYHHFPGEPHAEINALQAAGHAARGATAYVTLEPCSHFGRTPPCADALIQAGVKRVVVAITDPDARVSGRGIEWLRNAGIDVDVGVCETAARDLNEAFIKHRTTGLPYVTVKIAMTAEGKTAMPPGESPWITSEITRRWVHRQLRMRNQAILVGIGTIRADDPRLTARLKHRPVCRQPLRIVVDTNLSTPLDSNVMKLGAQDGLTYIAHASKDAEHIRKFSQAGAKLIACSLGADGKLDLAELLAILGTQMSVVSVLVEAGMMLDTSLLKAGLVDRWITTFGPKMVEREPVPLSELAFGSQITAPTRESVKSEHSRRSGMDTVWDCKFDQVV